MHMSELETRIRERAYAIWEAAGRPDGQERQHWEQAAREVLASGRAETGNAPGGQKAASSKATAPKSRSRRAA